jgi:hypothetical protein
MLFSQANDTEVANFIRATFGTDYHPSGTCRMGGDEGSTVVQYLVVAVLSVVVIFLINVVHGVISINRLNVDVCVRCFKMKGQCWMANCVCVGSMGCELLTLQSCLPS